MTIEGKTAKEYNKKRITSWAIQVEWDNGEEKTFIIVSLHGATKLAEAFESFGYKQEEDSLEFKSI